MRKKVSAPALGTMGAFTHPTSPGRASVKTRNQVLIDIPLISVDGRRHTAQLVQTQSWHGSMTNPRWIDGPTFVELDGEQLEQSGESAWRNPETGEEFTTV